MPGCLYAPPSANRLSAATLSWAVGTADPLYPLANVATLEPDVVSKALETTATLRATFPSPEHLEGVVIINTNWASLAVTLTNNAGMAPQTITVPARRGRLPVNARWDLTDVANATATQWNLAVAGAPTPVAIGQLQLLDAWSTIRLRWEHELRQRFPVIEKRTGYQKRLQYRIPVSYRLMTALAFFAEDRRALRALRDEADGSITPWPLVPDLDDDDVMLVQFTGDDASETYRFTDGRFADNTASGVVDQPIAVEEVNAGIPVQP